MLCFIVLKGKQIFFSVTDLFFCPQQSDKEAIQRHPIVQAERSILAAGNLSFGDHELRLLEQLHCVLSEIGNVLGLVRSLRAGDSRHASSISRYEFIQFCCKKFAILSTIQYFCKQ